MTNFDKLLKVFHLYKTGRPKAAKAIFNELPKSFRFKLLEFASWVIESYMEVKKRYKFDSPNGQLLLDQTWLNDLLDILSEVF